MDATFKFNSIKEFLNLINFDSLSNILDDAKTNWVKGSFTITEFLNKNLLYIEPVKFQKEYNPSVSGLFFDIGLVCTGIPEDHLDPSLSTDNSPFFSHIENDEKQIIDIGINFTSITEVSKEIIINRGALLAILAHLLEQSGRKITITQYCSVTKNNDNFYGSVLLKDSESFLDLDVLSFWLCHPGVLYNCWARVIETIDTLDIDKFQNPIIDFGKNESDIFMPGINEKSNLWNYENTINWICKELDKLNINYFLA